MSMPQLEVNCPNCQKVVTRSCSWIDPTLFKTPEEAGVTSRFNCSHCEHPVAIRISFLPNKQIKLKEFLTFKNLFNPKANNSYYLGGSLADTDDISNAASLSESVAFSLLDNLTEE